MDSYTKRIGEVRFTDGIKRAVYMDPDGRQWVRNAGRRVYGNWMLQVDDDGADTPIVVKQHEHA